MGKDSKIIHLRKRLNLTQRQVAEALGVTDQTVSNWEQGRSEPKLTFKQVKVLCQIFQCSLEDLPDNVTSE